MSLSDFVSARIVGQDHVIPILEPYITLTQRGYRLPGRTAGSFLFMGPTGSGKTEMVSILSEYFHGEVKYLSINCGEFQLDHEVAKLIGAPPGYLGHKETSPILTKSALNAHTTTNCPMSILLFDEFEKGADSLQRILLNILDKGTLRLGDGSVTTFENTFVFFTSNLGTRDLGKDLIGFHERTGETSFKKDFVNRLSPEFRGRLDEVVIFNSLTKEQAVEVARINGESLLAKVFKEKYTDITTDCTVWRTIAEKGFSPVYGARSVKKEIVRQVIVPISELIADGKVSVFGDGGKIVFQQKKRRKAA